MASSRKEKKKRKGSSRAVLFVIAAIVLVFAVTVSVKSANLLEKDQAYAAEEQELTEKIEKEEERTEELEEKKIYVQTKEYIEKIAREKLSLVYPGEVLYKIEE